MNKSVVILGTGLTLSKFNAEDHNSSEIWAVGSAFSMLENVDFVDMYFCLHKNETVNFDGKVITQKEYPLEEIIEKYESRFFTNSISYMIAYALFQGFNDIKLYGVDMEIGQEYTFERPSVTYWIGYAKGLSAKVSIASEIDNPVFLYGFEDKTLLLKRLKDRMEMSKKLGQHFIDIGETEKGNQYIGQYYDNKYWLQELLG